MYFTILLIAVMALAVIAFFNAERLNLTLTGYAICFMAFGTASMLLPRAIWGLQTQNDFITAFEIVLLLIGAVATITALVCASVEVWRAYKAVVNERRSSLHKD